MKLYQDDRIALSCNIMKIFCSFQTLKIKCGSKRRTSFTEKRKKQISHAIQVFGTEDILTVLIYLTYSKDNYATFMRENNYTELSNIFNENKWEDKLNKALKDIKIQKGQAV